MPDFGYVRDGAEDYRRSSTVIRAEADLARSPAEAARGVARMTQSPEADHARL